jgi:alcohol dehydrogenase YqhD (iron-dependent ADH family)
MAMTKVEAAKLTQDMMLRGVIETIITESMILELLPFMEVRDTVTWAATTSTSGTARKWNGGSWTV